MQASQLKALVTGGASGLGLAVARRIVAAGGRVAMLDVQDEAGTAAANELGAAARFIRCDVTDEAGVSQAVGAAHAFAGGLNLAVNCAGIVGAGKLLGKDGPMAGAFFAKVIAINLTGTVHVDKAAAALMQHNAPNADGERGLLIHTASVAAYEGQIGQIPYAAAKGGVVSMTLVAARDLSPLGIRVVTIAPGTFLTPAYGKAGDQLEAYWGPQIPHPKRMGRPTEYAALVQHICESDYLNGEVIRLDGALRFPPK